MTVFQRLILSVGRVFYRGTGRFCPHYERESRRFLPFGVRLRPDVLCPHCASLERHRFLWLFLRKETDFFAGGKKLLHFAPEPCLEDRFRATFGGLYTAADIVARDGVTSIDVTDTRLPDASCDVIFCSHVLEHVEDDRRAMRELNRVLRSDGWAMMMVPIRGDTTYEDFSIRDKAGRLKAFGQDDHVRVYGMDFVSRLEDAGFSVRVVRPADVMDRSDETRFRIPFSTPAIFFCTKGRR